MKYEFTGEQKTRYNRVLNRIRYLQDYPEQEIKKGQEGGWIESEKNLDQEDESFVLEEAVVMENASLKGNVIVKGSATIRSLAVVKGKIRVNDDVLIMGNSTLLYEPTEIDSDEIEELVIGAGARILDNAWIEGFGKISGSHILHNSKIVSNSIREILIDESVIQGTSSITSSSIIKSVVKNGEIKYTSILDSKIKGQVDIYDSDIANSIVSGMAKLTSARLKKCMIQNESFVSRAVLENVHMMKRSKVKTANLHSKRKYGIVLDDDASLQGVKMEDVMKAHIKQNAVIQHARFVGVNSILLEGSASILSSNPSRGLLTAIEFSNMYEISMTDFSKISNPTSWLILSFSSSHIQMSGYAEIEGAFDSKANLILKDFSSLKSTRSYVQKIPKMKKDLLLQNDETILHT